MDEVKDFEGFVNEQQESNLRGFSPEETIKRMKFLSKVLPDDVQFGVPADFHGNSTTYKNIQEAVRRIQDLSFSYQKKNKAVKFYCFAITFNGTLESEDALKEKMNEKGMLYHKNQEKYGKYNTALIAKYFRDNVEDADNIKSFTFALAAAGQESVESTEDSEDKITPAEKSQEGQANQSDTGSEQAGAPTPPASPAPEEEEV